MNVLRSFTNRSLKLNKKRTVVTMIGIILSVALICAVAGMFISFQETIIQTTIEGSGRFHTMFRNVPSSSIDIVRNNRRVEHYHYLQLVRIC